MRDSYHREADTVSRNRIILTPRNVMNEVFKFYREHLYPITPIPSFRHCLMWALQSKLYTMNWQFNFHNQLNWAAAEANWQLNTDTDAVFSGNAKYDIVMAACFVGRTRHDSPGDLGEDCYLNVPFDRVAAEAMDMREAQGDEEVAAMYEADTGPTIRIPVTDHYPLDDVVRMLHSLPRLDEDSADIEGLPSYAEAVAQAQAAEESGNDEEDDERDRESEERKACRSKYILTDAEEAEEGE